MDSSPAVCEGDVRAAYEVYNGTLEPSHVPLTAGQILAIGDFSGCSGTLIAPTWVLSAKHCQLSPGAQFCMGEQPDNPESCVQIQEVYPHPEADNDLALLELSSDAREVLPGVEPIPIMTDAMSVEWIGQTAEGAGYGQTQDGTLGTRYFTAEPIVALDGHLLTVDGEGEQGLCNGDSGGPVMVIAPDNTVRVAGALYGGDVSCLGRDSYTRTDLFFTWVERYTGPTVVGPGGGCGSFDAVGSCAGGMARWCDGGELKSQECPAGSTCGWDEASAGFRCITGEDPCQGYDRRGGCDSNVAYWCEGGELRSRDCGTCGHACDPFATADGAYCRPDPCMGIDFLGHCDGDVAEWCENGELLRFDCAAQGTTCGYLNDQYGYYCL